MQPLGNQNRTRYAKPKSDRRSRKIAKTSALLMAAGGIIGLFAFGLPSNGVRAAGSVLASVTSIPAFEVHNVIVNGNLNIEDEQIIAGLSYAKGMSMAEFDVDKAHQDLMKNPGIESVSVRKVFPDTIVVDLVESDPIAIWKTDDQIQLISRSGRIVGEASADFSILPQVVGAGANDTAAEFLSVMHRFPMLAASVQAYVRVGNRRWDLKFRNGIRVLLPEDRWQEALSELYDLQARKEILDRDLLQIDMRLADRIVVKLRPDTADMRRESLKVLTKQAGRGA